jgi:hypothetical protein
MLKLLLAYLLVGASFATYVVYKFFRAGNEMNWWETICGWLMVVGAWPFYIVMSGNRRMEEKDE